LTFRHKEVDAFIHSYISEGGKRVGVVVYNDELLRQILAVNTHVPPKYLPMLVPPRPWMSWQSGGYLTEFSRADMARIGKHPQHKKYMDAADAGNHMSTLYHALDCLGSTGWRINRHILEIAKTCWNTKEIWPSIPSGHRLHVNTYEKSEDIKEDIARRKTIRMQKVKEQNRYSQRCDTNYKILIAESVSTS